MLLGFSTSVGSHTDSWSEIISPPSSVIAVRWVCCLLFVCVNENPTNIDIYLMVIALNTYGTTSLSDWMFCCYFTVEAESTPGWFSVRSVINSSQWAFFVNYCQIRNTRCVQSTHKGVNLHSKDVTQAQQQRPQYPTVTLTWHASKYKVHKLHQRILSLGMRVNTRYINSIREYSHLACEQIQGT